MGWKPANTHVRIWRDADLPGLEVRFSSYKDRTFREHIHATFSVDLILTGRTAFLLEDACHDAEEGQIALIGPGAVHACNPDQASVMTYFMFYVDVSLLREMATEMRSSLGRAPPTSAEA